MSLSDTLPNHAPQRGAARHRLLHAAGRWHLCIKLHLKRMRSGRGVSHAGIMRSRRQLGKTRTVLLPLHISTFLTTSPSAGTK